MMEHSPFVEEGRTRLRNFTRRAGGYLVIAFIFSVLSGVGVFWYWTRANMGPLQKLYLRQYLLGYMKAWVSGRSVGKYQLLVYQAKDSRGKIETLGATDAQVHPVRDQNGQPVKNETGWIFAWNRVSEGNLNWRQLKVNNRIMVPLLRDHNYDGESFIGLLMPSFYIGLLVFLSSGVLLIIYDQRLNKKYEEGKFIRGTRLTYPEKLKFENDEEPLGLGVPSFGIKKKLKNLHWLRIPLGDEFAHATILGDTGVGKSQLIHLFLWQIAQRKPEESVIVYDPAGEFITSHFRSDRGDIVLNPLDARFPFWNPPTEVRLKTDREMLAESFFPGSERQENGFFLKATRQIFAHLLSSNPTPDELISWLTDEKEIDKRVKGTEMAQSLYDEAHAQRGGVLATLSECGSKLRLLPTEKECADSISLTDWAQKRKGWIFITSTQDTRTQLKPLHTVFLDLLMKRLMSCDLDYGREHPCWIIADESHSLGRMSALYSALTEGRKFGLKLIIGTQNKTQFQEHYGTSASTMLSASILKIAFRCNEPESARWVSDLIGESEWRVPRIGTTASVADQGRDSMHYSNNNERKAVISREEVMGLHNLNGYWKYQDQVVPFRFKAYSWPKHTSRFEPRKAMLASEDAKPATVVEKTKKTKRSIEIAATPEKSTNTELKEVEQRSMANESSVVVESENTAMSFDTDL